MKCNRKNTTNKNTTFKLLTTSPNLRENDEVEITNTTELELLALLTQCSTVSTVLSLLIIYFK